MSLRNVQVFETGAEASAHIAERFLLVLIGTLSKQDVAHAVLTGGTGGLAALAAVAENPKKDQVDWASVHLWWGDERWVAADSEDRNVNQAREALLGGLDIPAANVHEIAADEGTLTLDQAAERYAEELKSFAGDGDLAPTFDVLMLGVGPDGHIASLFPGFGQVNEKELAVVSVRCSPKPPPERVSLTLPAINAAKRVWFTAQGVNKESAVRLALANMSPLEVPASGAKGNLETVWFLDRDAAGSLNVSVINDEE